MLAGDLVDFNVDFVVIIAVGTFEITTDGFKVGLIGVFDGLELLGSTVGIDDDDLGNAEGLIDAFDGAVDEEILACNEGIIVGLKVDFLDGFKVGTGD